MSDRLKAVAAVAGLSDQEKKEVDGLLAALSTHRQLLNLPQQEASEYFNTLPAAKQASLKTTFGEDPEQDRNRGWLASAAYYTREGLEQTLGRVFSVFGEASDFMTRGWRMFSIAGDQNISLAEAWNTADDKGDKVFRPAAIAEAKAKFGSDRVNLAMRLAARDPWAEVWANATDAQKQILSEYRNGRGDGLFEDALEAVDQAKYSFGRDVASALGLRGTGAYKWVSGLGDAVFRLTADPFIMGGKAKRIYDVAHYSLGAITMGGAEKVAEVFSKPTVKAFWNEYGSLLEKLNNAQKAGNLEAAAIARTQLKRLAPEFGDTVIAEFASKGVQIRNADDARNYFLNVTDAFDILKGQAARRNPLMPRLDAFRKARISTYTATDKIFNINKIGPDFLRAMYVSDPGLDDIATAIVKNPTGVADTVRKTGKLRNTGSTRYTFEAVSRRIDAFAAKWEKIPKSGTSFDHAAPEAVTEIYRIARLSLPRYQSKMIAEAYAAAGDVGRKKEIYRGLWTTIMSVRGVDKTPNGQRFIKQLFDDDRAYAAEVVLRNAQGQVYRRTTPGLIDGKPTAVFAYQATDVSPMPSLAAMDTFAARDGLMGKIVGFSHSKTMQRVTDYWSILTLAGPRFAVRNAIEDLAVHLANGMSPVGFAKGRWTSTTMRLLRDGHDVGLLNRYVFARGRREKYHTALAAIKAEKIGEAQKIEKVRKLTATAIAESRIAKWGILNDDNVRFLQEQVMLGGLDNALADASESAKMALRGTDRVIRARSAQEQSGAAAALIVDDVLYERSFAGRKAFKQFSPGAGTQERVSWIASINAAGTDELGRIAIRALDGNENLDAINAVAKYLQDNPELFGRFKYYGTEHDLAEATVDATASLFSKMDGSFNWDFYRKVVDEFGDVRTSTLSLGDLPEQIDDIPAFVSGPTYLPVAEGDNIAAALLERGWDWMGEMNARFTREGIMLATMLEIREDMHKAGFEKQWIERYLQTKNPTGGLSGAARASAEEKARRLLAEYVEQKAVAYTLAYVDNPAIRTQMAFASRNFSRFYRATEDFFRRAIRSVRYNPASLAKASLVYEGVSHAGFVQEDQNGERYFLYPGLAPVYKAVQGALALFGQGTAFKSPVPVQFGGKLNMITPSMDPNALFPTFSGPLGAFSTKTVANIIGWFDPDSKAAIETTFLGPYAEGRGMVEALLPAHINRIYAALNKDERDSQWASAFRKAVTYMEASGQAPKPTIGPDGVERPPSAGELEEYRDKLSNMTAAVLGMRWFLGLVAPASPQLDYKSDMADWMRDAGVSSFKAAFNTMVDRYDGDYERAMQDWAKYFPTEMPYTVSENQSKVAAYVRASDKAAAFLENNKELVAKYPQGAPFLMPVDGEFTFEAWKLLKNNGFSTPKPVGDFLREVQSAGDYVTYKTRQKEYEDRLKATPFDWEKKALREEWLAWASTFKGSRPLLQERLANYANIGPRQKQALDDLQFMLQDPDVRVAPKTRAALRELVDLYNEYKQLKQQPLSTFVKDMTEVGLVTRMKEIAGANPNAGAAFSSLFSGLMGVDE